MIIFVPFFARSLLNDSKMLEKAITARLITSIPQGGMAPDRADSKCHCRHELPQVYTLNRTIICHQGRVEAGYRCRLWSRADVQSRRALWYSLEGREGNCIWFDVYGPGSQEYFRCSNVN